VVGAINTPQPPHFKASKFSANTFNTKAIAFNTRHNLSESKSLQVQIPLKAIVTRRESFAVIIWALALGSLFFFPILVPATFVIKARDTNCVVVLVGTKCPVDWEEKLTRSRWPFERGKGLKETQSSWPPQRGVGVKPKIGRKKMIIMK
jgi:hypothetical protein